jgi:hypothetical protein
MKLIVVEASATPAIVRPELGEVELCQVVLLLVNVPVTWYVPAARTFVVYVAVDWFPEPGVSGPVPITIACVEVVPAGVKFASNSTYPVGAAPAAAVTTASNSTR